MKGNSPASQGSSETRMFSLLREIKDRLRALENRPKITVGGWRLYEDSDGNLVASRDDRQQILARATLSATKEEAP